MVLTENSLRLTSVGKDQNQCVFFYSRPYVLCKGNEKIRFPNILKPYTERDIYPTPNIISVFLL